MQHVSFDLSGSDSVSLQGEDKAMKRYRSLNMNGDVVAKVCIVKLLVASVASFLVKHINIIINNYFNHSLYMYAFVWIGSLLF